MVSRRADIAPAEFTRYLEPFVGSAAVFFALPPTSFVLADSNFELMNCYKAIRDNWREVEKRLNEHQLRHSDVYYYKIRNWKPRDVYDSAARFIYLNRTCWNGLYRVNQRGQFNVPIGTKDKIMLKSDKFDVISERLRDGCLVCQDFDETLSVAGAGDFVFVDPPYTVKHNLNGFLKYNETVFSWEDQLRLKLAIERAVQRGAAVTMTNANSESIHELYEGLGSIEIVERSSVIAAKSHQRGKTSEVIVRIGWSSESE